MLEEEIYVARDPFIEIGRIRSIGDIYQRCHEFDLSNLPSFTLVLHINLVNKCAPSLCI